MKARKCEMCGAPLHGAKCEYCGTEYERDKNDDLYPINELGYLQAELNNMNFTQASVAQINRMNLESAAQPCCCNTATQIQLSQANVCSALQAGMITMNEARDAAALFQIISRRMGND